MPCRHSDAHNPRRNVHASARARLRLRAEVVAVMRELGIDLAGRVPTKLTADLIKSNGVTLVFTMGCGDKCPYGEARHVRVQALVARACGCRRKALGCRPGADGVGA